MKYIRQIVKNFSELILTFSKIAMQEKDQLILIGFLFMCGISVESTCNNNPYFNDSGPLVNTSSGLVMGKYITVLNGDVAGFFSIPFAQPPVREKRFRRAEPVKFWKGILDATQLPSPCMQYSSRNYEWIPTTKPSEDCLYLNVWTPTYHYSNKSELLPVIVWVYGGGFYSGSTDLDMYDGSILSFYGNVIVVSMNYRVGVFGFLNVGSHDAEGNMGLHDQYLALIWIKDNIKYFGGDSSRITLMGESAGAMSISLHMISPISRELFQRAILQSATAYHPMFWDSLEKSQIKAKTFANVVGCFDENSTEINDFSNIIICLRKKDSLELAKAEDMFTSKIPFFFLPSIGNSFLSRNPINAYTEGDAADVDVLIGNTKNEGSIFMNYFMPNFFPIDHDPKLDFSAAIPIITALFQTVPDISPNNIYKFYLNNITSDSVSIATAISDAFGDYTFTCPVLFLAENLRNVRTYWFTHRSLIDKKAQWIGASHFNEVPYVFGKPLEDVRNFTSEDGRFSRDLIQKWSSFARHGNPMEEDNEGKWPKFTANHPITYELNAKSQSTLMFPRKNACEFWAPYFIGHS